MTFQGGLKQDTYHRDLQRTLDAAPIKLGDTPEGMFNAIADSDILFVLTLLLASQWVCVRALFADVAALGYCDKINLRVFLYM